MLQHFNTDQYVHVFSFDLTKAFDTVRHETLMNKVAQLNIPDNIYNWIKAFFEQHFHCTRYAGECSTVAAVKASVIQGSGLGPASFIVTAADLHPTTPGNRISNLLTTRTWWYRRQTQVLDWVKYPM